MEQKTVGVSPKAIGAAGAALLTPLVLAFAVEQFHTNLDVNLVQAGVAAVVTSAVTFGAARLAKPGTVVAKGTE